MKILLSITALAFVLFDCSESAKTPITKKERFVDCDYEELATKASAVTPAKPCDDDNKPAGADLRQSLSGKIWSE